VFDETWLTLPFGTAALLVMIYGAICTVVNLGVTWLTVGRARARTPLAFAVAFVAVSAILWLTAHNLGLHRLGTIQFLNQSGEIITGLCIFVASSAIAGYASGPDYQGKKALGIMLSWSGICLAVGMLLLLLF